jgi:hypothetical protein
MVRVAQLRWQKPADGSDNPAAAQIRWQRTAARHERYSVLVGATGSKSPHADILWHGFQADRERHAK